MRIKLDKSEAISRFTHLEVSTRIDLTSTPQGAEIRGAMKTPLAWRNVMHSKVRSLIALCGISFAILLIFMQLGFYAAARSSATNVYEALDFDLLVLSPAIRFRRAHGAVPARSPRAAARRWTALNQSRPSGFGMGEWRNVDSRERWNILTLGVEPAQRPFRDAAINEQLPAAQSSRHRAQRSRLAAAARSAAPGVISEVQNHRVQVVGRYAIGAGFVAGATMVTGRDTFTRDLSRSVAGSDQPWLGQARTRRLRRSRRGGMKKRLAPVATVADAAKSSRAASSISGSR